MSKNSILIFLIALTTMVYGLHLQDDTAKLLDELKRQQTNFEASINGIISNINKIDTQVSSADNIDDKILILQNAIISERDQIFQLSTEIIPPFNISKASCEKMTDQQKVILLEKLSDARQQVNKLKQLTDSLPQCDQKTFLLQDIKKEITFLDSIESIIYTDCSMNVILSPTIFQTNIYAKNWILGNLTIDNLIDQYYLRSRNYENVTNCPIQYPFFNGKDCIICEGQNPVFNISSKQCVNCGEGVVDNNKKACIPPIYYTNWTNVDNYDDGDLPLPQTPTSQAAVACPQDKPYYDGQKCIECLLPRYFSVQQQICKDCELGQQFDLNQNQCDQIQIDKLTRLSETRWVTEDRSIYDVLSQREQLLQNNKTTGKYQLCPQSEPYYDGIACIKCENQFSIDTKECTQAPLGSQFNTNLHRYLPPEEKQTNPDASNLLGNSYADHSDIQDCNQTHPYFDGIACINCEKPFELFDTATRRCTICQPQKYYNQTKRACVDRPIVYISENQENLMATPTFSIQDYQDQITNVTNNPEAIIVNCEDETQYSNFETCFSCNDDEYFNVEYKICDQCTDGVLNQTTRICKKNIHYFTDLNAPNIIDIADLEAQRQRQQLVKSSYDNVQTCPSQTPYYNGTQCIKCSLPDIFFDYKNRSCIGCPQGLVYSQGQCKQLQYISNTTALSSMKVVQTQPNDTLQALQAQYDSAPQGQIFQQCWQQYPYFNKTTGRCTKCYDNYAIDLAQQKCVPCQHFDEQKGQCYQLPTFSNITALNKSRIIETQPNSTLEKLAQGIQQYEAQTNRPYNQCPSQTPFFNNDTSECGGQCGQGQALNLQTGQCEVCQYYDAQTKKCYGIPTFSNISSLENRSIIENPPNSTIDQLKKQIQDYQNKTDRPYNQCPSQTPFFNNDTSECGGQCGQEQALNLSTGQCEVCQYYDAQAKKCYELPTFSNVSSLQDQKVIEHAPNVTISQLKEQISAYINQTNRPYKQCPSQTPVFDTDLQQCIGNCTEDQAIVLETGKCSQCDHYDEAKKSCYNPGLFSNVSALNQTQYVKTEPNGTLEKIQAQIDNYTETTGHEHVQCPEEMPYYNISTAHCTSCQQGFALDLAQGKCVQCQYYRKQDHTCWKLSKFSNIEALNDSDYIQYPTNYTVEAIQKEIEDYQNKTGLPYKQCEPQTPFFSSQTGQCFACQQGQHFDLKLEECVICNSYDIVKKTCPPPVPHYPNLTNTKWVTDDSTVDDIINWTIELKQVQGAVQCSEGEQFYNNITKNCQPCQQDEFFNYDTSQCIKCDPLTYDSNVHKCLEQVEPNTYQTSLNSSNLLTGGIPMNQFKDQYQENKQTYPNIKDCPEQTPYYDGINCIQCPEINPYFNLALKQCQQCPEGQEYSADRRQCISVSGSDIQNNPDPSKMYANIFHQQSLVIPSHE